MLAADWASIEEPWQQQSLLHQGNVVRPCARESDLIEHLALVTLCGVVRAATLVNGAPASVTSRNGRCRIVMVRSASRVPVS